MLQSREEQAYLFTSILLLLLVMPTGIFILSLLHIFSGAIMLKSYMNKTVAENKHVKFDKIVPHV